MLKINARKLLKFSTDELYDILTGDFILTFDDGEELIVNAKSTLYSSYAWNFHREFDRTPLLAKHHVSRILGDNRLSSDTHLIMLGVAMWSTYDEYVQSLDQDTVSEIEFRDSLAERIYRYTNELYNDLTYRLEENVTSIDITDFIEVINNKDISHANDTVEPNQQSIDKTYNAITDTLMHSSELDNNPVALATRSKLVSLKQVHQCIGPRGYLTDTDSNIFSKRPILRGYVKGFRAFYDSFVESRSAAKSLIFSKTPLQQAEYFSRRLQLMSQIVKNVHMGDCGTKEYLIWTVRKRSELKQLAGKYYATDDGGLKIITADDVGLVGKSLKIRAAIHCAHEDPYGICSTCFGELALSVPEGTNIGQMTCTTLAQKISQIVMSIKHLDGSSVVEGIILSANEKLFLKVSSDDNSYMMAERLKGKDVKLLVRSDQAKNITDINEVKDIRDLNITRVSEITEIGICITDKDVKHTESIEVNLGQRLASMTYEMLEYVRSVGWDVDEKGNYLIDMKDWNWSKDIFTLPLRHYNMSDHGRSIADMLESSVNKMHERDNLVSPNAALIEFFDLVNNRLAVNLAVLDVVLYSSMVVSAENGDFSLPKPWTDNGLGVMKLSMANRSLSTTMAYEGHRDIFISPDSYNNTNRPDSIMDGLVLPQEVFKYDV